MTTHSKTPRQPDALRPVRVRRRFTRTSPGSVLYQAGGTTVLCTASVSAQVPPWMVGKGRGWVTAEYSMLPGSTAPRKSRERDRADGRTTEIQRLIGRSLRAVVDMTTLGERTITIDCDVLEADGGTRTASITGGFLALLDALHAIRQELPDPSRLPLGDSVAAVSVGIVEGTTMLDLDYPQDAAASVDMNVVMTGSGRFIEIQGTGEESTFSEDDLQSLLAAARLGICQLTDIQRKSVGPRWPFP